MPLAQRLAAQVAELDAKLLAGVTATITQVAQHIEGLMAAEMGKMTAPSRGLG